MNKNYGNEGEKVLAKEREGSGNYFYEPPAEPAIDSLESSPEWNRYIFHEGHLKK